MTLHEKLIELGEIGFDVKFEQFKNSSGFISMGVYICMRYHGIGSTKVENRRMVTPEKFKDEHFVIAVLGEIYKEMKPHALGNATLQLEEND